MTQQLVDVSWGKTIRESGLGPTFWQNKYAAAAPLVTKGWISAIWEFLNESPDIILQRTDGLFHQDLRFPGDDYLMKMVLTNTDVRGDELRTINYCRRFLKIELLSDILTADGKHIRRHCWTGERNDCNNDHRIGQFWDSQPRPTGRAWQLWQHTLTTLLQTNNNGKLTEQRPQIDSTTEWQWFYHLDTDRIYHRFEGQIQEYAINLSNRRQQRTRHKAFQLKGIVEHMPIPLAPITPYRRGDHIYIEGISPTISSINPVALPTQELDTQHIWQYIRIEQIGTDDEFMEALYNHKLMMVSDGSAKDHKGACAWILTSETLYADNKYMLGQFKVPTCKADSYRAECFGLFGGLLCTQRLLQRATTRGVIWTTTTNIPSINIGCDNISALRWCLDTQQFPFVGHRMSDFDIITAVRHLVKRLKIECNWRHVKGHQDGNLDIWGQLNVEADRVAGLCRCDESMEQPPNNLILPGEKWHLLIDGFKIYKKIRTKLVSHLSQRRAIPYWIKKGRINSVGAECIDWECTGKAMASVPVTQRQWITKRAARECGANAVLYKRKAIDNEACALCGESETVLHVLQCQDHRARQQWHKALMEFKGWLELKDSDPVIVEQLILGLRQWQANNTLIRNEGQMLLKAQDIVGWDGILEGCLSLEWGVAQE
jgi:hypothetical protein